MKGVTYSDVLMMPTYERRFFLSLLNKDAVEREEKYREMQESGGQTSGGRGSRSKKVSGKALKSQMKSGVIPNK